ncbi:sel1 repeat family protein, partial [Escherichia coli]|nr:sel1 repeat family protein [Escherichia coli]
GVGVDCAEAASWFRRAAEQDHAGAQYNLGVCYYMGRGVAADKTEARRWIAAAAEKGNADAVKALRLFD